MSYFPLVMLFCIANLVAGAESVEILPGSQEDVDRALLALRSYQPPFLKNQLNGHFINSKDLQYLPAGREGKISFEDLLDSSENIWIALNKRDFQKARSYADHAKDLILGKNGLFLFSCHNQEDKNKIIEIKTRVIGQIDMLEKVIPDKIDIDGPLFRQNFDEVRPIYSLVSNVTNTRLFPFVVAEDFAPSSLSSAEKEVVKAAGDKARNLVSKISEQAPGQAVLIRRAFEAKKSSFRLFLDRTIDFLRTEPITRYSSVDKGRSSCGHRNTCLFNSIFYFDVEKGIISSTKIGSLDKAKTYMSKILGRWRSLGINPLPLENQIISKIGITQNNRSAEAPYAHSAYIEGDRIYTGGFGNCSILEVGCQSLCMNFEIFPNQRVRGTGDKLENYYGCGYYWSEDCPVVAARCSLGHATAMIKKL